MVTNTKNTSTEQQLNLWENVPNTKFAAGQDESAIDFTELKSGKAPGPGTVPVEQYKASPKATQELFELINSIHDTEIIPDDFVLGDFLLFNKKKSKKDCSNYRVLGLLNHAYKSLP